MSLFRCIILIYLLDATHTLELQTTGRIEELFINVSRTNYTTMFGSPVTLQCKIIPNQDFPTVHVYWIKIANNGLTSYLNNGYPGTEGMTMIEPSLTITGPTFGDIGQYFCSAKDQFTNATSQAIYLNVIGGIPTVAAESEISDIQYGLNHTIACTISSVPAYTTVYWIKITNGSKTNITYNSLGFDGATLNRPSLTILKAKPADNGEYICNALNEAGHGWSNSITITVFGNENYPIVDIESNSYIVRFLDTLTIKCYVQENEEYPVRRIYWQYINNGVITLIESGNKGIAGSTIITPSLTIEMVTTSESGLYTCFATNDAGTAKSKPIQVIVNGGLPVVKVPEIKYTVWYSKDVTLLCNVTADPPIKFVYWEKVINETRTVINKESIGINGITPDIPSLTLTYSTKVDTGVYRCFATNDVGTGRSGSLSLEVIGEKPSFNTSFNSTSINFGEKATLTCNVTSILPLTSVYWEKDINGIKTRISAGTIGTNGISVNNPSLIILYSTSVDSGLYTCFAGNVVGISKSLQMKLTVIGGLPEVTIATSGYTTIYGREIEIECEIMAYPSVILVYWQKKVNNTVSTLNRGTVGTKGINITMPSLVLTFPTTEDSGSYTCFATNKAGTQKSLPATLIVEGDIPDVTIRSQLYIAHFGDSITLECDVKAFPSHTKVYWHKTVNEITTVIENGYKGTLGVTLRAPSLTIVFATAAETGRYTCVANNAAGIGKSQSTYLDVLADIPVVTVPSETYKTGIEYSVTLVCIVKDASPAIFKVYWQRYINNATTVITYGSTGVDGVTVDNPSLTILSAQESMAGEYTCFAINSVGTGSSLPTFLKVETGQVEIVASATSESHLTVASIAAISSSIVAICAVITVVITIKVYRIKRKKDSAKQKKKDEDDSRTTDSTSIVDPDDMDDLHIEESDLTEGYPSNERRNRKLKKMLTKYKNQEKDIDTGNLAKLNSRSLESYSLDSLSSEFNKLTGTFLNDYLSFGNKGRDLKAAQQLMHWSITVFENNENTVFENNENTVVENNENSNITEIHTDEEKTPSLVDQYL